MFVLGVGCQTVAWEETNKKILLYANIILALSREAVHGDPDDPPFSELRGKFRGESFP